MPGSEGADQTKAEGAGQTRNRSSTTVGGQLRTSGGNVGTPAAEKSALLAQASTVTTTNVAAAAAAPVVSAAAAAPIISANPWKEYFDAGVGLPYFCNELTGVTQWERCVDRQTENGIENRAINL